MCIRMEIPDSISCSLFPGQVCYYIIAMEGVVHKGCGLPSLQVVAVEGINNYNGIMIPSRIFDQVRILPWQHRGSPFYIKFNDISFMFCCLRESRSPLPKGQRSFKVNRLCSQI